MSVKILDMPPITPADFFPLAEAIIRAMGVGVSTRVVSILAKVLFDLRQGELTSLFEDIALQVRERDLFIGRIKELPYGHVLADTHEKFQAALVEKTILTEVAILIDSCRKGKPLGEIP